ncbi:MAG: DEAD/DEAH box helicase, partial [Haloferula sp.]
EPKLLKFENESKIEADAAGSAKLDYLADLLDTLVEEGRRVLLFSQFTSMLDIIAEHLSKRKIRYLMLTGGSKNRGELVDKFQQGETPLFLISLKAGGTGLNLTAADTVIHYDPWWNPAAEAQATDRAYRIGQKNPVFVHKLICQGTVEERIHQLQQKKSELADALLSDAAKAAAPDQQTLSALLAPLG